MTTRTAGWTVIGLGLIAVVAAAPKDYPKEIVPSSGLSSLIRGDQHSDEIASAIERALAAQPRPADAGVWQDVRNFYGDETEPAWVTYTSSTRAASALRLLSAAAERGLSPADYHQPELSAELAGLDQPPGDSQERIERLAAFDVALTHALLSFGRDVSIGHTSPEVLDTRWKRKHDVLDLAAALQRAPDNLDGWIQAVQPHHPQYGLLQSRLRDLVAAPSMTAEQVEEAREISLNLERWRWMPDDLGENYLLVNIPSFDLIVKEGDTTALQMRVIVGKPALKTPPLSSAMDTVVFSPFWHIPDSIASAETVPEAAKDPGSLTRRGIEVLRVEDGSVSVVDPAQVDWNDKSRTGQLMFRQRPGPQNALGFVKFLFPNPFDVYLHDTPTGSLFAREKRALSHGCVRAENPEALARYVLRGDDRWDDARIEAAMHAGTESSVKLGAALPVHITYFTAWVGDDGQLVTYPDVYGYDKIQRGR